MITGMLSYIFGLCLFSIIGGKLDPSSCDNKKLPDYQREVIRKEGYCMALCGIGYDSKADGYDDIMNNYQKTKEVGTFEDLLEEILGDGVDLDTSNSDLAPLLRKKGQEVHDDDSLSDIQRIQLITDVYCKFSNYSFEECMEIKRSLVSKHQEDYCLNVCLDEISKSSSKMLAFKDMPPIKQKFEKCLDEFRGQDDFFNYHNRTSFSVKEMLRILQKNGFVVIKNFFPPDLMGRVNEFLNNWDELGKWNNFTYSDFYSSYGGQLREYKNRLEVVLPYVDPFETVLSTIHKSILMELMSAYGSHQPINIDFPATIISRPGAKKQQTHSDHGHVAGMLKLNVAIHDIPEESGPTSFCPCTHQRGVVFTPYANICKIKYHPKLVKAGTVTIYDQSMKHHGMANNGDLKRRYILDLSYNIGNVKNNYTGTYPELAAEHIRKYRESYQNLNLVFD